MPAQVIIFDLFQTLIDIKSDEDDPMVYDFMSTWFSYQGIYITPIQLKASYRVLCHTKLTTNHAQYPDIDIGTVFQEIMIAAGAKPNDSLVQHACTLFRQLTTTSLNIYPETIGILQALQPRVRLALVSNTQRLFSLPELMKFKLESYFEQIIFSSDLTARKPNPKIFQAALAKLQVAPQEVVFVGDNLFDDIWGAQQSGMQTVWIKRGVPDRFPSGFVRPTPNRQVAAERRGDLAQFLLSMI